MPLCIIHWFCPYFIIVFLILHPVPGWQDYLTNDNDQAVVEICITRITTAIRETGSIERHSTALVGLWESCLEHNLTPQGENTEDTPHAKIASDITSCILQVYTHSLACTHHCLFYLKHIKDTHTQKPLRILCVLRVFSSKILLVLMGWNLKFTVVF